jgi:hypothetical protein
MQASSVQIPKMRAGSSVSCEEGRDKIPDFCEECRAEDRVVGRPDAGEFELLGNGLG